MLKCRLKPFRYIFCKAAFSMMIATVARIAGKMDAPAARKAAGFLRMRYKPVIIRTGLRHNFKIAVIAMLQNAYSFGIRDDDPCFQHGLPLYVAARCFVDIYMCFRDFHG